MKLKTHRAIAAFLNLVVVVGSFEALITILNLNQPVLYIQTSFYVGAFYILQIFLLYDLHLKKPGTMERARQKHKGISGNFVRSCNVLATAIWDRCGHLRKWNFVKLWLNYLVLPQMIFWGSICIFYINFGFPRVQQIFVLISSVGLFLNYLYLKEVFLRGKEVVDNDIFVALSIVKIYAGVLVYGASLALVRRYCLDSSYLVLAVFSLTFLLIYQALFQHRLINLKNLAIALLISVVMSQVAAATLAFWGYNYFTAAVFLGACYNLMWGIFHYYLDKALTWHSFWEILIVGIIIASMVFSVTNFKARILDTCQYQFNL